MVHVPYRGGGPAVIEPLGGQVLVFFGGMTTSLPHSHVFYVLCNSSRFGIVP